MQRLLAGTIIFLSVTIMGMEKNSRIIYTAEQLLNLAPKEANSPECEKFITIKEKSYNSPNGNKKTVTTTQVKEEKPFITIKQFTPEQRAWANDVLDNK